MAASVSRLCGREAANAFFKSLSLPFIPCRRSFSSQTTITSALQRPIRLKNHRSMCVSAPKAKTKKATVTVTFIKHSGEEITAQGKEGDSLLDFVVNNNIEIDGFGACEGTLACSTCHVILPADKFDEIPDKATDEEIDMLDLAYKITDTSRLGCQICMTKKLDGLKVHLPQSVIDQRNK